jgi:Fe-S oxidoreductase
LITGPAREEGAGRVALGPKEMHIVLLDNGRMQMRESGVFREALYCIRCGACLNRCPVFASIAGQVYGHIYQGGIGAVLTAFMHSRTEAGEIAGLCMGCQACKEACPAGIDIPRMITMLKAKLVTEEGLSAGEKLALRGVLKHPRRLRGTARLGAVALKPFTGKDAMVRSLPRPLKSVTDTISLPSLASTTLRQRLSKRSSAKKPGQVTVALYAGCVAEYAYPELGENAVSVLRDRGAHVVFPADQACCGAPALYAGDRDSAIAMAKINIRALEKEGADLVVTVCPGCAVVLKKEYPELLKDDADWSKRANAVSGRVRDFSQVALELKPTDKPARGVRVTYHDPCHLRRGLGVFKEPRELLRREGYDLVEMPCADVCCGFGGDMLLKYPELSAAVLKRKLDCIEMAKADIVVTNCTACILQIRGGLDKRKSKIRVLHTAELLAGQNKKAWEN